MKPKQHVAKKVSFHLQKDVRKNLVWGLNLRFSLLIDFNLWLKIKGVYIQDMSLFVRTPKKY